MPKVKLEPPDFERCQSEFTQYRPFIMGGNVHQRGRCENKPDWLVRENKKGKDGLRGSMTVCDNCRKELEKQRQDVSYEKLELRPALKKSRSRR